ncbi:MAG: hypothetical protein Q4A31_00695 [Corynebacterium sp.]|uniref:hypothetical protein n=1 Tax=Corynebacterium sp. TaxID=1720 RepID=UPI0026DA92B2|nr:hypothetical protein [Corynebacterium sp.]MDO4760426.1 hypothetical protein [Corynebacterium sp.]
MSLSVAASLSACTPPSVEQKLPKQMGNATPVASPKQEKSDDQLVGTVVNVSSLDGIEDLEAVDNTLVLRSGATVLMGTVEEFKAGEHASFSVDEACGDITTSGEEFILACPDGIYSIDATASSPAATRVQETPYAVTSAVKTSSGSYLAAGADKPEVLMYDKDGETTIRTEGTTDQLVSVAQDSGEDAVYRINREKTIIQNIYLDKQSSGAVLRVGLGVGQVSAAEQGMALTADAVGHQFGVYFAHDVIRLHQTTPTAGQSVWDVAWDAKNKHVWAATTSDNKLRGYDISSGSGEEKFQLDTVMDARNLTTVADGSLVAASATSPKVHIIDAATLRTTARS